MTARVLVVDDVSANVKLLEVRLTAEYFDVVTAMSGPEALAICRAAQCDIVLLDVMMPEMDGWEMLRRVQERHGSVPVIMFSGKVDERSAEEAASAGARGFLGKPFDPHSLIEQTKQLLPL